MRIQVNLATRPYVELRPFFLRLRLVMLALAIVAIALGIVTHSMDTRLHAAEGQINGVHSQVIATEMQKSRAEVRMRQPENAAVLERAHFLNALFLAKSFSWTAVMMDLEQVLPLGVQVTSIEPVVAKDGTVMIRLRVAGERDRAVELVRNLEQSRRFLRPRLAGESSQSRGANGAAVVNPNAPAGVQFDILAEYNPVPPDEPYHYAKVRPEMPPAAAVPVQPYVPGRRYAPGQTSVIRPTLVPTQPPAAAQGGAR